MKNLKFSSPCIKSHKKTIDFKKLCEGGSPELVATKKKLKKQYEQHQQNNKFSNHTAYSLYFNPIAFFDIHFILATSCIVLIAVAEKKLAENGIIGIAAALSSILRIAFPLIALGSILVLLSHLGEFL